MSFGPVDSFAANAVHESSSSSADRLLADQYADHIWPLAFGQNGGDYGQYGDVSSVTTAGAAGDTAGMWHPHHPPDTGPPFASAAVFVPRTAMTAPLVPAVAALSGVTAGMPGILPAPPVEDLSRPPPGMLPTRPPPAPPDVLRPELRGPPPPNFKASLDKETLEFVTEDVRLSTLQKKLSRAQNPNVALALARQISEAILYPDNKAYVKRATDVLTDALMDVFYAKHHGETVRRESAVGLGRVGYVLAEQAEADRFLNILWTNYDKAKKESVQGHFLKALAVFLKMRPQLDHERIERILKDVQHLLEQTQSGQIMAGLLDSLDELAKWKPKLFEPSFQDVVDILVGWHIDATQPPTFRHRTSEVRTKNCVARMANCTESTILLRFS